MAEKSLFWFTDGFNGAIGDGSVPYTQDEFARYNASTGGADGVFAYSGFTTGFSLATSGTASPLTVTSGGATVRGLFYFNDADITLAVSTPVVGTTGGRVILRADYTAATIRLAVKQNTDGVAAIPALTQIANDIWEIGLSEFTVTTGGVITVTDNRVFARSAVAIDVARGVGLDSRNRLGIADEGVTAAMAGAGVPVLTDRRGGDALDWSVAGTTNYTVGNVKIATGVHAGTIADGTASDFINLTLPITFSSPPIFTATVSSANVLRPIVVAQISGLGTGLISFTVRTSDLAVVSGNTNYTVNWQAVGVP